MEKVTKDTIIMDVIQRDMEAARVFFAHGMFCVGCPSASGESIEMASMVHGIDCNALVDALNKFFEEKAQ